MTPITWTKLVMFSAFGALYGTQLFLQDLRLSNVASVLSTHEAWTDIRRGTSQSCHHVEGCVRLFGIQLTLHIQKSCPKLVFVVQNDFFVFCIYGWLVQNSIVGRLTWNIGCKPKDGMVPRCVIHYDTCPVCLNLTDDFC